MGWLAWLAVGATLVARPSFPSEDCRAGSGAWFIAQAFAALALAGLAAAFSGRGIALTASDPIWAIFIAALWASAFKADYRYAAVWMAWEWTGIVALMLAVRLLAQDGSAARLLAIMVLGLSLGQSTYACVQEFHILPELRQRFMRGDSAVLAEVERLGFSGDPAAMARFRDRLDSKETPGTFGLANSLAGFLTLALPLSALAAFNPQSGRPRRIAARSACGLLVFALLLTRSRTAWVGAAIATVIAVYLQRRTTGSAAAVARRLAVGALAVALLTSALAFAGVFDRLVLTESSKSLRYRFEYWTGALGVIRERPILGVGFGNFQSHYLRYKLPQASEEVEDPHNFAIELWACAGPFAALAYLLLAILAALQLLAPNAGESGPGSDRLFWLPIPATVLGLCAVFTFAAIDVEAAAAILAMSFLAATLFSGLPMESARGRLALLAGFAGLHIHLLGSGGIGFPAVMMPAWLLIAAAEPRAAARDLRPWIGWALAFVGVVLALVFRASLLQPYSQREQTLARLRNSGRTTLDREIAVLEEAAKLLPGDQAGWAALAMARQRQMLDTKNSEQAKAAYREAVRCWETACQLEPRKPANYRSLAQLYMQADRSLNVRGAKDAAVASASWVVMQYPNSARNQLELADALLAIGKRSDAAERSRQALALDAATPHPDKKLTEVERLRAAAMVASSR